MRSRMFVHTKRFEIEAMFRVREDIFVKKLLFAKIGWEVAGQCASYRRHDSRLAPKVSVERWRRWLLLSGRSP